MKIEGTDGLKPQSMVSVKKRTVVANPRLEHAFSSRYTGISTPKISA